MIRAFSHTKGEVKLKAYVVYHQKTGKIVHRHWQVTDLDVKDKKERDEVFKLVNFIGTHKDLEIVAIDPEKMKHDKEYRINPHKKMLEELHPKKLFEKSGIDFSKSFEHKSRHCEKDPIPDCFPKSLKIFCQPPISAYPCIGSLNDPSFR